jgi:hypothetical protein
MTPRPNVRVGSNATDISYPRDVRFPPDSDQTADIRACLKGANNGSQSHSITSSARASKAAGTVNPSALAVFILMTSWKRVGCSTGKSAG